MLTCAPENKGGPLCALNDIGLHVRCNPCTRATWVVAWLRHARIRACVRTRARAYPIAVAVENLATDRADHRGPGPVGGVDEALKADDLLSFSISQ